MAKIYGDRWRIANGGNLGQGGQSQVYRVTDLTGEYPGLLALKRVTNGIRRHRFLAEIEAVKRLSHPNIIQLIDHSALDAEPEHAEKQYLVMPIADGGDLSNRKRLALYKNNIDSVITVSRQITSALIAAHGANIIHRDVKPANILFTGDGHDTLLADFGICLIREQERHTEVSEIVGPRYFMAPEVERGGRLDVGPEVDIFSLGKVIYYMISGGDIVYRENIYEPAYREMGQRGGRYSALLSLLEGMICPPAERIKAAAEVLRHLDRISAWDRNAQVSLMGERGISGVDMLNQRARDAKRARSEAATENERVQAAIDNIGPWLEVELGKVAAQLGEAGLYSCAVRRLADCETPLWLNRTGEDIFFQQFGWELVCVAGPEDSDLGHSLQLYICKAHHKILQGGREHGSPPIGLEPSRSELVMVPFYTQVSSTVLVQNLRSGFFTRHDQVGEKICYRALHAPMVEDSPSIRRVSLTAVTRAFYQGKTQSLQFEPLRWTEIQERRDAFLQEAIDSFILFIAGCPSFIGL